jgi:myo-inositol-1(or 4)-monophosphatase
VKHELSVAIEAAQKASTAILAVYNQEDFEVRFKAGDKGPLTEADLAADRVIAEVIRGAFPDDGYLSEEVEDDGSRLNKARVWIVDPLDGTREFTLKIPEFVVSIGLVIDGVATLGVLLNPATGELFAGAIGEGFTYNGEPVTVSDHGKIEGATLLVSRSEYKKGWFDDLAGRATLTPMGSVAYKFGLVAAGKAEASFTPKPRNAWDLAGGVACISAAGGRASNGKGEPYAFDNVDPLHIGVCGTNADIHDAILHLMDRMEH